jgi:hypothetical protein
MSYATERDAAVRTPQAILTLGVPLCQNFYAQTVDQEINLTEQFDNVTYWARAGAGSTVTADNVAAPDGSITADSIGLAVAGTDYLRGQVIDGVATSHAFTFSIFLKVAAGSGTITLTATDSARTEETNYIANLTTSWQRFSFHRLFTGAAGASLRFFIERIGGDVAALIAWGANCTRNPGDANQVILFPYRKRALAVIANSVRASRCSAADAGDGFRCSYTAPTCQAPADFNTGNDYEATPGLRGIREYKFCLQGTPLPFKGGTLIRPQLQSWDQAPQEIDGTRAVLDKESRGGFVTRNETVTYRLEDDADPGNFDLDKASVGALTNTGRGSGTFWRRWRAIHLNLDNPRGYAKLSTGYIFAGSTEADYQLRLAGPMTRIMVSNGGVASIEATDGLHVTKRKIPSAISTDNLLAQPMDAVTTSLYVDDPSEVSDPAPNADAAETFIAGARTGGPDWKVVLLIGTEKVNVLSKTDGGNPLTVQRGRWGTAAASHATNNAFSEIREFGTEQVTPGNPVLGINPMDAKYSLYREATIPWTQIDTAFNNDERDTWISSSLDTTNGVEGGVLFRRTLTEPIEIDVLLQEIDRDIVSYQFVTDARMIRTKVFAPVRPTETLVELTDVSHFIENSVEVETDLEARLSRVVVGWGLIPGQGGDILGDYADQALALDPTQEGPGFHGTIRDRIILSQWIRAADNGRGQGTAARILGRFLNGAQIVVGQLEAKDDDNVTLGGFCYVTTAQIQKPDGSTDGKKIMLVVRKERQADGRMTIRFLDTAISGRFWFWQDAAGAPASYDVATDAQRRYAFWAGSLGKVGATNADPYLWW